MKRFRFLISLLVGMLALLPSALYAQVVHDNAAKADAFSVTTISITSFTITSNANRAALVGLTTVSAVTGISVTAGGASCTAISNTSVSFGATILELYGCIAPASGSQTITASWTGSSNATMFVHTASGVDQTTAFNNGATTAAAFGTVQSREITSTSGDLTVTGNYNSASDGAQTTNQTQRTTSWTCSDTGPGTGTTTHTWTRVGNSNLITAGANFVQASAGAETFGFRRRLAQ